jgi:hypothetical protein
MSVEEKIEYFEELNKDPNDDQLIEEYVKECVEAIQIRKENCKTDAYIYINDHLIEKVLEILRDKNIQARRYGSYGRIQIWWKYYPTKSLDEYFAGEYLR